MQARSYFDESTPDIVLKSLFSKYDRDGNGSLSCDEVRILLQEDLGLDKQQIEAFSMLMDKDGSRLVSFAEFKDWVHGGNRILNDRSKYFKLKKAVDLFKRFDKDQSGNLDSKEFETLMVAAGGKKRLAQKALKELDKDNNGQISFNEFLHWLNWLPPEDID